MVRGEKGSTMGSLHEVAVSSGSPPSDSTQTEPLTGIIKGRSIKEADA